MNELDLYAELRRMLKSWWILCLAMLAGGLAGWLVSRSLEPVYEATAYYQVDLDEPAVLARNGLADLGSLDYARANSYLTPVYSVFFSPETEQSLVAAADRSGITLAAGSLHEPDFYVDRRGVVWLVTVRHADPETAISLANAWLQIADDTVQEALVHAAAAQDLIAVRGLLDGCLPDRSLEELNQCAGTAFQTLADLETFQDDLNTRILEEETAAQGMEPVFTAEISDLAEPSGLPVLYQQGVLMASGSLLGLLAAILGLSIPLKRAGA